MKCYNIIKNECDGRCQGCSQCPIAEEYWNNEDPNWQNIKRSDMFKYIIKSRYKSFMEFLMLRMYRKRINKELDKLSKMLFI
jgi:hypothetical protein